MKVLITGSQGFLGKNLCAHLQTMPNVQIFKFDHTSDPSLIEEYTAKCDFVFHLAGVNRPKRLEEYAENVLFTRKLLKNLQLNQNKAPILFSSSIQAELNNAYGGSKKKAEEILWDYQRETGVSVYLYRLPNVFGKWSRPNYNSVVATFCNAAAKGENLRIHDAEAPVPLVYVDDVIEEFLRVMKEQPDAGERFFFVPGVTVTTVGTLAEIIASFEDIRTKLIVPPLDNEFVKKLYSTYLSFLPEYAFAYELPQHTDERGSFAEFLRLNGGGQVSVNSVKPGFTKGNHWHHTKTEKFLVVHGRGVIRFRNLFGGNDIIYPVSSNPLTVLDIPPGYVHSITNTGTEDMILFLWANEAFDPKKPDTYPSPW